MEPMYIHSISSINPQAALVVEEKQRSAQAGCLVALEPDYKVCIVDAGLRRRMSRIVKMGVATAMDCLAKGNADEIDAIITATGLGCLGDTEKFMNSILDNGERLLNPTAFIQSTFNTIGAQIALLCKNHHYNMTYVHRGFSFESALLDAQMMLSEGEAEHILVGGIDELTESVFQIMNRLGQKDIAGEGAHFFVLGKKEERSLGKIRGISMFRGPLCEDSVESRMLQFLDSYGLTCEDIDLVLWGDNKGSTLFNSRTKINFKQYCGEYLTASSFGLWLGVILLQGQRIWDIQIANAKKILIYNVCQENNYSLILLEKSR